MPAPLILRIIGDARSYVKTAETAIGLNTKITESFTRIGPAANLSAQAQVAAAVKAIRAQEAQLAGLQAIQARSIAGSREQIAASVAVADAQDRLNRSLGVSAATIGRSGDAASAAGKKFRGFAKSLLSVGAGLLAFSGVSSLLRGSIKGADDFSSAQASLDLAIQKTGGDLAKLKPRYEGTAQAARKFGADVAEATTGLARVTLLTGGAVKAQRAYQEALVISRALGKSFNSVLTATAKGQDGNTSSLKKYGVIIEKGASGQEQFNVVMKRFEGQAVANTSSLEVYNASLRDSEIIIGGALLPVINKYLGQLGDWLTKMNDSGRLQKDVNKIVDAAGHVFHVLGGAVKIVNWATGGFAQTLELLLALKVASTFAGWRGSLSGLIGSERAGGLRGAESAAAGLTGKLRALTLSPWAVTIALSFVPGNSQGQKNLDSGGLGFLGKVPIVGDVFQQVARIPGNSGPGLTIPKASSFVGGHPLGSGDAWTYLISHGWKPPAGVTSRNVTAAQERAAGKWVATLSQDPRMGGTPGVGPLRPETATRTATGNKRGVQQWANYQLSLAEQIAGAQTAMSRGSADDVAAAKAVVARVKRTIAQGHLKGKALIAALQVEAGALSTIWAAEDAAAQERAAAAQKQAELAERARERIAAQIQNSIDPLRLEVALSKAQALGKPILGILKKMRAAARAALASGKLSMEQQREAWDTITYLNQEIADQAKKGADRTRKAAHQFRLANTRLLTAGLHLSDAQRAELRARLSQLGPGGHLPRHGTGAYGFEIGANGRPIHVHSSLYVDGKKMASNTTRHQQRGRRRNSRQRRGPNAGD